MVQPTPAGKAAPTAGAASGAGPKRPSGRLARWVWAPSVAVALGALAGLGAAGYGPMEALLTPRPKAATLPSPTGKSGQVGAAPKAATPSQPGGRTYPAKAPVAGQVPAAAARAGNGEEAPVSNSVYRQGLAGVGVRGLYLTGYTAGDDERFNQLLALARAGGLNAMVIDAKDDDGRITFETDIPLAREIGANSRKIRDVRARIRTLEENGIYPIARLVVFVDPVLSRARPEWAITMNGRLWRDRRGLSWTNPNRREVWEYNVAVAKAAAAAGFREIQFDYVRFPEKDIPGVTDGVGREARVAAVTGFLRYAREQLQPLGVALSADVFGLTTTVTDDMKIGQEYAAVAELVDYISPMVYPSHYNRGLFGLRNPNAAPYETVYNSMMKAREKTPNLPLTRHRPWIQDFSLYGVRYGKAEVEAQIRALRDAGIDAFLLWNPNNVYTPGVDYRLIEGPPRPVGRARPAPGLLAPNELGRIMILEYHVIGPEEGRWERTPENFRRDLEELYRRGYRPVNLTEVLDRRIDLPRGYSPVVLTFDDGTEGQFRYAENDGRRVIDPDSAVGILLAFHEKHPDWGLKATFYVNDRPFEQAGSWQDKIRFLVEQGFEVGNHTLTHANLATLDAAGTARELAAQVRMLQEAVPGLSPATLALPYGALPRIEEAAKAGADDGTSYRNRAFLLVGANPAPSPYSRRFDPYRLPRIQAVDSRFESTSNLDRWLRYFDENPDQRYVSDGDPARVTAP